MPQTCLPVGGHLDRQSVSGVLVGLGAGAAAGVPAAAVAPGAHSPCFAIATLRQRASQALL